MPLLLQLRGCIPHDHSPQAHRARQASEGGAAQVATGEDLRRNSASHRCSNQYCPGHLGKRLTAPAVQAVEAEEKEDREIICSEVFSDITCELDGHAKGRAAAQHHMPCTPLVQRHTACTPTRTHPAVQASWTHTMRGCTSRSWRHTSGGCGWHLVEQFVWDHFLWCVFHAGQLFDNVPTISACLLVQKHDLAEALLYVCRRLWGQPHVAPIYAMLLYQWLLLHRDAGGAEQRLKHLKVMVSGARGPGAPRMHGQ